MIGKIYLFVTPYYDAAKRQNDFKARPALIIGVPDLGDYNILPVSKVTKKEYIDSVYDIPIDPKSYPLLNLKEFSYARTHKQTYSNYASIGKYLGDMQSDYPDLYLQVLEKLEEYNNNLIINAL